MHSSIRVGLIILSLLTGNAPARANSPKPTAKAIGDAVICQCDCNMTVNACNHEQCSSRTAMQAMAEKEVAAGKDETAILQDFVLKYGVKVLAMPPPRGFNLTIWILPAIGFIAGLALVIGIVQRWRRPEPPEAPPKPVDPKLLAEIEEEMKISGLGP